MVKTGTGKIGVKRKREVKNREGNENRSEDKMRRKEYKNINESKNEYEDKMNMDKI